MNVRKLKYPEVAIAGWVQFGGDGKSEIVKLNIEMGAIDSSVYLDMTGDELIEWCKEHNHPFTCSNSDLI